MTRFALLITLGALALSAQDWARQKVDKSPRHREWVTVKHDGRNVETFVAYPESSRKTPVVLVIHEIFGHSDWVQAVTDQFAEAGYMRSLPIFSRARGPAGDAPRHSRPAGWVRPSANCRPTRSRPI